MKHTLLRSIPVTFALLMALIVSSASPFVTRADEPPRQAPTRHRLQALPIPGPTQSQPLVDVPIPSQMGEARGLQNITNPEIVMRLLVISADGTEVALPGIREVLRYLGVPFTEYVATRTPGGLTPQFLANGNRGNFQGVILTSGSLAYFDPVRGWVSALSDAEWQALWSYQASFGIRQVTWYTYPTPDYGFDTGGAFVPGSANPVDLVLTPAGRLTFSYLNPTNPLPIRNVWNYRAPALVTSTVTTLATDGAGNALLLTRQFPNGRENLAFTADGNAFILHSMALGYGMVNWLTRGLFIGERQVYVTAHMDDIFIDSAIFNPNNPNASYRITGNDLATVLEWQRASRQTFTQTQAFMFDMPFNGIGTQTGMYPNDTLTPFARQNSAQFRWINHTLTHRNLDGPTAAVIATEIRENINVANRLPLRNFSRVNMVTPEISGLRNPTAMSIAHQQGVRFLVSDTSYPDQNPPVPNTGFPNFVEPRIFMIPRRATNLFYNVSTPQEWKAQWDALYGSFVFPDGRTGAQFSYDDILDWQSDQLLMYLVKGEVYPWMFHQANMRAYAPGRTLITDLLDRVWTKYAAIYTLPILSPAMDAVGAELRARTSAAQGGVVAVLRPGQSITFTAEQDATVAVTGLRLTNAMNYGGQWISTVQVKRGRSETVNLGGRTAQDMWAPGEEERTTFIPVVTSFR